MTTKIDCFLVSLPFILRRKTEFVGSATEGRQPEELETTGTELSLLREQTRRGDQCECYCPTKPVAMIIMFFVPSKMVGSSHLICSKSN